MAIKKLSYLTTTLSLLFASPFVVAEDEISYSYLEAGYFDMEEPGLNPTGYFLKGSFEISDQFYIFAETKQGEVDGSNLNTIDFDLNRHGYGIGYKSNINQSLSWFASYSVNEWEVSSADWDVDVLRVGLRGQLTENLELNGSLTRTHLDYGDYDEDESGYQFGIKYDINDSFSLITEYEAIDNIDETTIGIRFSF